MLYDTLDTSGTLLNLALDEDQLRDSERRHTTEELSYVVFEEILGNQPPQIASPGDQANLEGDSVSLFLSATDLNGDPLTFSALGLPPGLGLDENNGEISGTITPGSLGSYGVDVDVTDGEFVDATSFTWNVTEPLAGVRAEIGLISGVTNTGWTQVTLADSYTSMVVIATPSYTGASPPQLVRIRNAAFNGFEMQMARRDGLTDPVSTDVHFVVIEEGVYNETDHGVKLEAVRFESTVTDHDRSWVGQPSSYQQSYTAPVVVGSVMTSNDAEPSSFWTHGTAVNEPPTPTTLNVGKTVTSDPNELRVDETLGYLVVETGVWSLGSLPFTAAVGPTIVRGIDNGPPYIYDPTGVSSASVAVATFGGMVGSDGAGSCSTVRSTRPAPSSTWWRRRPARRRRAETQVGGGRLPALRVGRREAASPVGPRGSGARHAATGLAPAGSRSPDKLDRDGTVDGETRPGVRALLARGLRRRTRRTRIRDRRRLGRGQRRERETPPDRRWSLPRLPATAGRGSAAPDPSQLDPPPRGTRWSPLRADAHRREWRHAPTRPRVPTAPRVTASVGNGDYRIDGVKFNMPGEWIFRFGIVGPAGGDSVTFHVDVGH